MVVSGLPSSPPLSARAHHVVRGVGGGLVFGAGPAAAAVQLPSSPAANLWSPLTGTPPSQLCHGRYRGSAASKTRDLEYIFAAMPSLTLGDDGEAAIGKDEGDVPATCVICLEACDPSSRAVVLACPQCSMQAHARCLSRWFSSSSGMAGNEPQIANVTTSASCPSCRGSLDWDALALEARRQAKRVPLGLALDHGNKSISAEPTLRHK